MERYDILAKLAEGGMGEVLLARATGEHGFKKLVAVKRIRPELAVDPEFFVRFVTEAKVTVSLSHANIVQVFDLARSGADLFLVMEYVRGADLSQLLRRAHALNETLPVPLVLHIASEALKGLAYAHGRSRPGATGTGVIHCDLSPSNLLVSYSGEVKLADFGIAQAMMRRQTADGRVMGKEAYMSPEQRAGRKLDARTDLYALGVVLETCLKIGDGGAAAGVPTELTALIAKMRADALDARPASATEVLKAVAELGRVVEAGTMLTAPEVGAWVARLVPPPPERDDDEFARALGQVLGAAPGGTGTQSRQTPARTFIARAQPDGTTEWVAAEGLPPVEQKRRRWVLGAVAGAVALSGVCAGAWWLSFPAAEVPPPAPLPVATAPVAPPAPAPAPAAVEAPVAGAATSTAAVARPAVPGTRHTRPERAAPGFLNVFAEPWANVVIDGRKVGTTPLRSVSLAPGSHQIRLEHPSRRPVEKAVRISSGRTELLDVDLQKADGAP